LQQLNTLKSTDFSTEFNGSGFAIENPRNLEIEFESQNLIAEVLSRVWPTRRIHEIVAES